MASLPQRILTLLSQTPGLTDRQITDQLLGTTAAQQPVNIAARGLAKKGRLLRRRRHGGLIGNYLNAAEAPAHEMSKITFVSLDDDLPEDRLEHDLRNWSHLNGWEAHVDVASPSTIEVRHQVGHLLVQFDGQVLQFQEAKLSFLPEFKSNVFGEKNNKTVAETLAHRRYAKFLGLISREHPSAMDKPLGAFLLDLKNSGNEIYKRFLNSYGDGIHCTFRMERGPLSRKKGLYCYCLKGRVVYVGRSYDPFEKRINQGYGTIHPKNCYIDGQATNCHLNALIASDLAEIALWVCPLDSDSEIEHFERRLIHLLQPQWNIALRYE